MRVSVLANGLVGLEVTKFLLEQGDDITSIVIPGQNSKLDKEIVKAAGVSDDYIFSGNTANNPSFISHLESTHPDFMLTIYWPWLLKSNVFKKAINTVNFHPAPLPVNRGWYPHVHSIIDGSPLGVTLHQIDENADTGPIWAQKILKIYPDEIASDVYKRLQKEMLELFKDNWSAIKSGDINPVKQKENAGNYHSKSEIEALDLIDMKKRYLAKDLINLLRARSFGNSGFAYFEENGKKIYLKLSLESEKK
jgi:methionyl-tRNA formyltransferase